jgi:hypothetical protein
VLVVWECETENPALAVRLATFLGDATSPR